MAFLHFHIPDRFLRIVVYALTLPVLCAIAWVQEAHPQASQEADPSRIEDQLIERESQSLKPAAEDLNLGIDGTRGDGINVPPFILSGVTVDGATAFSGEEIAATYASLLATEIGAAELESIAGRITDLYREAGYVLSRAMVLPQDVTTGIIRIQIIEGYVSRVTTDGTVPEYAIKGYVSRITAERPLTLKTLERNMLLINDMPGVSLKDAVLSEDGAVPGAHILALEIGLDRMGGSFFVDNRGSAEVGPVQAGASVELRNTIGFGDAVSLAGFTVPSEPRELKLIRIGYATPIGSSGLQMSVSGTASWIDAGGTLDAVGDESNLKAVSASLAYPVIRARDANIWLNASLDVRSAEERTDFGTVFDEDLVVLRGSVSGMAADGWGGRSYVTFRASKGVRLMNAAKRGDPLLSRTDADPQAATLTVDVSRYQQLVDDLLSVTLAGRAQRATDALVSSEEFSLGGARFGRGFEYGELTGDDGIAGSVEFTIAPDIELAWVSSPQIYAFYDTGAVWNRNVVFGDARQSLSSAGAGIRLTFADDFNAGFELAKPLDRDSSRTNTDEWQALFFLSGQL
jgi:hemolysin activation/secretion protein